MNSTKVEDHAENNCVVCCREVYIYAIGECDHPVCFECATRMRVLCRQNECPICRRELPKILFVKKRRQYADIANISFPCRDRKYNLYFEDEFVRQAHVQLLEHRCHICEKKPDFPTFVALKDHVRKTHELFFCDICIKHLLIFTRERKCYNRQDLATHRRRGDLDDTSHRGHPLCEFCNDRFLDDDELFRHLRREHFFCHFCDTDGHNHYYSDYEYLRKHFRAEHFLCEEGECINEKFTTAFRSEIDLKAHRASVHNKGLTKAQSKQARTLELEFSIAPRGAANSNDMPSRTYYDGEDSSSRRGRRPRGGGYGNSSRGGSSRDYGQSYNSRYENDDGMSEQTNAVPNPVQVSPNINMNSSQDFPVLGVTTSSNGSTSASGTASPASTMPDTLARKLAKINRFTVGSGMGDEEFPALHTTKVPPPSKFKGSNTWGATGMATLSLTSSQVPTPRSAVSRKTLTVKLNSQDDFPGLSSTKKQSSVPKVSIQVDHKQKTGMAVNSKSAESSSRLSSASERQPVVTRMASSQNITFINPPASVQTKSVPPVRELPADDKPRPPEFADGLSKTDGGWYVLKKGKVAKSKSPPVESKLSELSLEEEFPSLATRSTPPRLKKESKNEAAGQNSWKVASGGQKTKPDAQKTKQDAEYVLSDDRRSTERIDPQQKEPQPTTKNKKKKKSPGNGGGELENTTTDSSGKSKNGQNGLTEGQQNGKLKRTELKMETLASPSTKDAEKSQAAGKSRAADKKDTFAPDDFPDLEPKRTITPAKRRSELKVAPLAIPKAEATLSEVMENARNYKASATNGASFGESDFPDLAPKRAPYAPAKSRSELKVAPLAVVKATTTVSEKAENVRNSKTTSRNGASFGDSDFPGLTPKRVTNAPAKSRSELKVAPLAVVKAATTISDKAENARNSKATAANGFSFGESDFPDLTICASVPPGFGKLDAKPARPPPGFVSVPTKNPPPGFGATSNPLSATFTNSVGQNFSFPQPMPHHAYAQPEESQRRNQELAERLLDALDRDDERFALFKNISGGFRQGSIGAGEYYNQCVELMGRQRFATVFPELLALLPDIGKQQELLTAHNSARKANQDSTTTFLVCASCQQVLASKDFRAHESGHNLDNFPALDNLIHTSHISWVKKN